MANPYQSIDAVPPFPYQAWGDLDESNQFVSSFFWLWVIKYPPSKKIDLTWQMENPPLEDGFPIEDVGFSSAILVFGSVSPCNLLHFVANKKATNPGANWWVLVTQLLGNVGFLVCPIDQLRLKGPIQLSIIVLIATFGIVLASRNFNFLN